MSFTITSSRFSTFGGGGRGHHQLADLDLEMQRFRAWYNYLRPHQHLGGRTPADAWEGRTTRVAGGRKLYQEWGGALRGFG